MSNKRRSSRKRNIVVWSGFFVLVVVAGIASYPYLKGSTDIRDITGAATSAIANVASSTTVPKSTFVATTSTSKPSNGVVKTPAATLPSTSTPVVSTGNVEFGVADAGLLGLNQKDLETRLSLLKASGVEWIRYDVDWSRVQSNGPNSYNWNALDTMATALKAENMQGLGIITYTPAWARASVCAQSNKCYPADPNAFATFANTVVKRYEPQGIHTWEVWNEENITDFWKPSADPVIYATLLEQTYAQIKLADPTAIVLTGGLARSGTGGGSMSAVDYMNALYADGAQGSFDAVALHPYSFPFLPSFPTGDNSWLEMPQVHAIMTANGDGNKKIWVTEFGAPTNGPGIEATTGTTIREAGDDHVSEDLQERILADALRLDSSYSWVGPLFWYSNQDAGTNTNTQENFFGLFRYDGSAKPAFTALKGLLETY